MARGNGPHDSGPRPSPDTSPLDPCRHKRPEARVRLEAEDQVVRGAQEAAPRSRSVLHSGPDLGWVNLQQSDGRNEVVVRGARQSITEETYAAVCMLKSRGHVNWVRRLMTEFDVSSYVDNRATGGQEVGAELQQLVSLPLGEITSGLPACPEVAAHEPSDGCDQRDDDFHLADVNCGQLFGWTCSRRR